ncbi:MAG: response regulator [Nitrospirota bacterium]
MTYTVMIVDDNPDDIEIMRRALTRSGVALTIKEAFHGETALKMLKQCSSAPFLILLDLKMPGMNGIDTLRRIRADASLKHIPIIMVTNSLLEADKNDAYAAGANGFLHKAFNFDQFSQDITTALKHWLKS